MSTRKRLVSCYSFVFSVLALSVSASTNVYIADHPPAGSRVVTDADLVLRDGVLRLDNAAGDVAIDPGLLAGRIRQSGGRALSLDLPGTVHLSGDWRFPAASLRVRAGEALLADDLQLRSPGAHLLLDAPRIVLGRTADVRVGSDDAAGGEIVLSGNAVDIERGALLDASGAGRSGGRILIRAQDVRNRGQLYARGRGRIEVEAGTGLQFSGPADTGGGLIRLDPSNMIIGTFGANSNVTNGTNGSASTRSPSANTGQLDAATLATLLATNDVIVHTVAGGTATGIVLPAGFTPMDATGGDIDVQADVVWSSSHFLWLLAHDDLIVRANVQNNGGATGGSVVGLAGWDGTTFTGLDTNALDPASSNVYGAVTDVAPPAGFSGRGDVFVLGPPGGTATGVAFGSRIGTTVVAGGNVSVLGSIDATFNNAYAMIGYRINASGKDATGDIRVVSKTAIKVLAGVNAGAFRAAQIGHGGVLNNGTGASALGIAQDNLSGNITVTANGAIQVMTGTNQSFGQIGHGGGMNLGVTRGNVSGDIDVKGDSVSLLQQTVGVVSLQSFAMIGNGGMQLFGKNTAGTISGNIRVQTTGGDLQLLPIGPANVSETRIGHGGLVDTTFDSGNSPFVRSSVGAQSGSITVVVARDLLMQSGDTFESYSQIGHGGYILAAGLMGPSSGTIDVTVGRDAILNNVSTTVGNPRPAQIGHGGTTRAVFVPAGGLPSSERQAVSGAINVNVARELRMLPGTTQVTYVQIGNGGMLWTEQQNTKATLASASGDITVQASSIEMRGGTGPADSGGVSYPQIGNGGPSLMLNINTQTSFGPLSGAIHVTTTGANCLAGPPGAPLAILPCGHLVLAASPVATSGSYAWIGHGGEPYDTGVGNLGTQAGASGDVVLNVAKETNLVNGPTDFWHIGHLMLAVSPLTASNVSLHTGTLDFTTATTSSSATISDSRFWPQFVFEQPASGTDYADNLSGGRVELHALGNAGNDGNIVIQQPLTIPASASQPVVVRSSDDLTIDAAMTNSGSSTLDLVADDANPASPGFSPTAVMTVGASGSLSGNDRLFAVAPSQFIPGSYVPPATAYNVWYGPPPSGSPVLGANFKSAAPNADLSVTKVDTPDPVNAGANLTYTITVGNAGPGPANTVALSDTLPAGTTFVSLASPAGWSCTTPAAGASGTVSCSIATLTTGNALFTLVVGVGPSVAAATVLTNTAAVSSPTPDPNPGNESGTATTTVSTSADVSLAKVDTPDPVTAGTNLTYTITAGNAGPSDASTLALNDTLPAGTSFVSLAAPAGWSCTTPAVGTSGSISCSTATLTTANAVFTLVVGVDPSVAAGTVVSNTATIAAATSDPNPGNESATATTTVATSASLSVTKVGTPDPVTPGTSLTYTITANNAGPSNAATVSLAATLPAGTTFVSLAAPGGWSCTTPAVGAGGTVTCTMAAFAPGNAAFTLVVAVGSGVAPGTVLSNSATISSATADPNPGDESGTATTTVGAGSANLSLTNTDSPDPVAPGANLTYTITASNAGPSDAASVSLTDTLPAGTTFVSLAAPGGWSCTTPAVGAAGTVTCTDASLAPGNAVFTLVVAVDPSVPGGSLLSDTATITSATADPSPGNESATATTAVGNATADLSLTKSDSPDPATAGLTLTYTITASNAGPSAATSASLTDTLPAGTTFVSLASPAGWSCTTPAVGATGTVTCTNGSMAVGNAVFTLAVAIAPTVTAGTTLTNTATVSSATTESNPGNESATATTTVVTSANLSVTKVDSPDPVTAGTSLTYTITASNAGPSNAASVSLSDTLPAGTTFVSLAAPAGWSCTTPAVGAGGSVTCTMASFAAGNAVFTLTVAVGSGVASGTVLSNTATISSATSDPNPGDESATATTTVGVGSANLSLTNSDSPDPVAPGANLTYTITASNAGPSDAASVSLTDTLPAGTTFVSLASPAGWSCTTPAAGAGGTVTCTIASLASGNAAFTLTVAVGPSVPIGTVLSDTATISSSTADPNPGNESATATTTINLVAADLSVTKTDSPDPVTAGGTLTYTITATNAGPNAATSVSLSDTLPAGTTFVSLSSPAGWSCTTPAVGAGGTVTCTNASLSAGSAIFTLAVAVAPSVTAGTALSNSATVSSLTTDPNPGNESATATTAVVTSANLSVTKVDTPDPVTAGTNLTYTITASNAGPSNAATLSLSDTLPSGTTFVSLSLPAGWSCTTPAVGASGTVTCTAATFAPGNAAFTLVVAVASSVSNGTTLSNTATLSSATPDPNPGNESATATTTVSAAAAGATLSATKTATGQFVPGGAVIYTITLTNSGAGTQADNPGNELTDVLPPALTLTGASATSGTTVSSVATNTVTWNGSLAPGASVTITINATINPAVVYGTTIANQAAISYDSNGDGTNDATALSDDPAAAGTSNPTAFFVVANVPVAGPFALMMLALALAALALFTMRRA
jgi:uncharacterized repeat protein (TIGR01451 family)/fimbrial isopeptide formation D2 family protein